MGPIADQFSFVNKSAHSTSLSHSDAAEEKFVIQSYVQGKHRKKPRGSNQRTSPPDDEALTGQDATSPSSQPLEDLPVVPWSGPTKQRQTRPLHNHAPSRPSDDTQAALSQAVPAENGIDPVHSTAIRIDACTYRLLQYPFSGFVETTFRAESLGLQNQAPLSPDKFRHRRAVTERLRRCIDDELVMSATLAYCSSSIRSTIGSIGEELPPEFYILKAIGMLRSRLQQPGPIDAWLIVSIYALSVSEMWAGNHEASATHLKIIRHFIPQVGGIAQLEPYVMESLILGDKYLALGLLARGKSARPILPLDWDPGHMSPARVQKLQLMPNPELERMASGFFALDNHVLGHEIQTIVTDLVACLQTAHSICKLPAVDPVDERWLFLRHQALIYRLLSCSTTTTMQECVRLALLVWKLKVTKYFGAQRCSRSLLPHLKDTLLKVENGEVVANLELLFWIVSAAAVAAEETADRQWFVRQTGRLAASLGLEARENQFTRTLTMWFFVKSERGVKLTNLVCAVREMQTVSHKVEDSDIITTDFCDHEPETLIDDSTAQDNLDVEHIPPSLICTTLVSHKGRRGGGTP